MMSPQVLSQIEAVGLHEHDRFIHQRSTFIVVGEAHFHDDRLGGIKCFRCAAQDVEFTSLRVELDEIECPAIYHVV